MPRRAGEHAFPARLVLEPEPEHLAERFGQRHEPLLVALADHPHRFRRPVHPPHVGPSGPTPPRCATPSSAKPEQQLVAAAGRGHLRLMVAKMLIGILRRSLRVASSRCCSSSASRIRAAAWAWAVTASARRFCHRPLVEVLRVLRRRVTMAALTSLAQLPGAELLDVGGARPLPVLAGGAQPVRPKCRGRSGKRSTSSSGGPWRSAGAQGTRGGPRRRSHGQNSCRSSTRASVPCCGEGGPLNFQKCRFLGSVPQLL